MTKETVQDFRVEIRIKNNALYSAIFQKYKSVRHFCREHGLTESFIGLMINLRKNAVFKTDGTGYTATAIKVAEVLQQLPEDLFNPEIYEVVTNKMVFQKDILSIQDVQKPLLIETIPDTIDKLQNDGLKEALNKLLDNYPSRDVAILKMRFGIDHPRPYTLKECGRKYGITIERIRQIEIRILRRLRYSKKNRLVRGFLEAQ